MNAVVIIMAVVIMLKSDELFCPGMMTMQIISISSHVEIQVH